MDRKVGQPAQGMRVALGQLANRVGEPWVNAHRILEMISWAEVQGADCVVFPELALPGYSPEDHVLRREFLIEVERALRWLAERTGPVPAVVGTIRPVAPRFSLDSVERHVTIAAAVLCDGSVRGYYDKVLLPTHDGFSEGRNFLPGETPDALWRLGDVVAGISICADIWRPGEGPPAVQAAAGAQVLLVPNASPYHRGMLGERLERVRAVARANRIPVVYVNGVGGGHTDAVFDGGSFVVDSEGGLIHRGPQFEEAQACVDIPLPEPRDFGHSPIVVHTYGKGAARGTKRAAPGPDAGIRRSSAVEQSPVEEIWWALVCGTRDFAMKNGFGGAVVCLSGDVSSAVTAAVAAEALGPANVLGVAVSANDVTPEGVAGAPALAASLGIRFDVAELGPVVDELLERLRSLMGPGPDTRTLKALGRRLRAAYLQALADELGYVLLATANKTGLAIAPATEGDAGVFAPLKDCLYSLVLELARRCDERGVIPAAIIDGAVDGRSELRAPLAAVDWLITAYVEKRQGRSEILAAGPDDDGVVLRILRAIENAELERRQAPPGVTVTKRPFASRQIPLTPSRPRP